jgi:hypothetical protein
VRAGTEPCFGVIQTEAVDRVAAIHLTNSAPCSQGRKVPEDLDDLPIIDDDFHSALRVRVNVADDEKFL